MWNRDKVYEDIGFVDDMASILDVDRVTEICRRRAERHDITIKWDEFATTAKTNRLGEITLPTIRQPVTKDDLIRLHMYVVHECGHLLRPEVFEIANKHQPNTELLSLYNIIEDDSMERDMATRHLGDAKTLGLGNALLCLDGAAYWKDKTAEWRATGKPITEDSLKPMIVLGLQQLSRRSWDGWSRDAVDEWLKLMPEEGQPLMTELVKEGWVARFREAKTPHDTWDISCDLYERLYPSGAPEQPEPKPTAGNDEQPSEKEASSTEEDTKEPPSIEEGAEESDEEDETPSAIEEGYVINWEDAVTSQHEQDSVSGGQMGITWENKASGKVGIRPDSKNTIYDLASGTNLDDVMGYKSNGKSAKWFMLEDKAGRALANQIRKYVQSQTRSKFKTEQEHGRLDKRNIMRLAMPPIDKGHWNKKLFYTRKNKRALNTAIHILVDWSGSMQGSKQVYAALATQRAAEVFSRSLRMPTMISSFTTGRSGSDIAIIKHFDKPATEKQIASRFGQWYKLMGGNADADAVMWGYRRLRERRESRKLLLVLSDGAPANSYGRSDAHDSLLAVTNQIQNEGKVELFGLGIRSTAVKLYYNNYKIIQDDSDINGALLTLLKEGIQYG